MRIAGCPDLREFWRSPIRFAVSAIVLLAGGVAFFQFQRLFEPASIGRQERTAGQESIMSVDAISAPHRAMVDEQLRGRDITDERVLAAMLRVPRHAFVPAHDQDAAYADGPLPIGHGQTISQPYIVALMTQLVRPAPGARALDVGTGSGYQAAILAELVHDVYSIEIVCPLADEARERLASLGYQHVTVRCGDGYQGWKEHSPFDVIIVAAAPHHVPQPLLDQLAPGGRMVIPVGNYFQELRLIEKQSDGSLRETDVAPVSFVPMTGEAQHPRHTPSP